MAQVSWGACQNLTPSYTSNSGLQKPQTNSCGWDDALRGNFSIIDSSFSLLSGSNTFSGTNIFSSGKLKLSYPSQIVMQTSSGGDGATIDNPSGLGVQGMRIVATDGLGVGTTNAFGLSGGDPNVLFVRSFAVLGSSRDTTGTYSGFITTSPIHQSTLWSLPTKDGNNGQLLGTDGGGHLGWFNDQSGGGGGGASVLTINQDSVQITSPTAGLNYLSPFLITSVSGGTTAQIKIDGSSVTMHGPILTLRNYWNAYNNYAASTTYAGNVNVSSGMLILNDPGTAGYVFTSGGAGTVPSWSPASLLGGILNQNTLQTGSTFYVSSGTVAGPFRVNSSGETKIEMKISGSTYTVTSGSNTNNWTVGHALVVTSTNGTIGDSGSALGGTITGMVVTASSVSFNTQVVLRGTTSVLLNGAQTATTNTGNNGLNIWGTSLPVGYHILNAGSSTQGDQFVVPNAQPVEMTHYGAIIGALDIGEENQTYRIAGHGDVNAYLDLRDALSSSVTLRSGNAFGEGPIRIVPAGVFITTFSAITGIDLGIAGTTTTVRGRLIQSQQGAGNAGTQLVSPSPGSGAPAYLMEFDAASAGIPLGYMGFTASDAGVPGGLSLFNNTKNEMMRFANSGGGVWIDDAGGLSIGATPSTNLLAPSSGIYTSGGAIFSNQQSSVTINGNTVHRGGMYVSTWTASGTGGTVTGAYTTGPTDHAIFADFTTVTAGVSTITLTSAANAPRQVIKITKVDSSTQSVAITTTGTDLIDGTTRFIFLDALGATAELISSGAGWWAYGYGVRPTPLAINALGKQNASVAIGVSSSVYSCALDIPVPVAVKGFRYTGIAMAAPATVTFSIYDRVGNLIVSTGPVAGVTGLGTVLLGTGYVNLAPGQYYIGTQGSNTAISMTGSANAASNAFCEVTANTAMEAPAAITVKGGSATGRNFSTYLLINGGRSTE